MSNIILQNLNTIIISFVLFFIILLFTVLMSICRRRNKKNNVSEKLDAFYLKIKEDIKFAVAPRFIQLSPGTNEIIDLAVEVWRMEQRIIKSAPSLPENQRRGLENSIQKLKRCLEKYDIEIVDYKNTKYNDGLNLDILSVEKDATLVESMVKETIEPTIMLKGQVVRKAKIILLINK